MRAHYRNVIDDRSGNSQSSRIVKIWAAGTATETSSSTTGSPFAGELYAGPTGGAPISHTMETDADGAIEFWCDLLDADDFDVGINAGNGAGPRVYERERWSVRHSDIASPTRVDLYACGLATPGGSTSAERYANATANKNALNALIVAYAAINQSLEAYLRAGSYYYEVGVVVNSPVGAQYSFYFAWTGDGRQATKVIFLSEAAAATACITVGGNGYDNGEVYFPTFRDLYIRPLDLNWTGAAPTAGGPGGWTIEFKDGARYPVLERVWLDKCRWGIRFGENNAAKAFLGPMMRDVRCDLAPLAEYNYGVAVGVCLQTFAGGDLTMEKVQMNGNSPLLGTTIGWDLACPAGAVWDTVMGNDVIIKDHAYGIRGTTGGRTTSVIMTNLVLDGICQVCLELIPSGAGGQFHTWQLVNLWMASLVSGINLDGRANSTAIFAFGIVNGNMAGANTGIALGAQAVDDLKVIGGFWRNNGNTDIISVSDCHRFHLGGGATVVGLTASAGAAVKIAANVTGSSIGPLTTELKTSAGVDNAAGAGCVEVGIQEI